MKIFHFETVESTTLTAEDLLSRGENLPFCVLSDGQTGGKGTKGRIWSSPKGGLYVTYLLPSSSVIDYSAFSLSVAVVVVRVLKMLGCGIDFRLKWPNDIYVKNAKVAGILVSRHLYAEHSYVSVGIGMNVFVRPAIETSYPITSLADHDFISPSIKDMTEALGKALVQASHDFEQYGFVHFRGEWLAQSLYKDKKIILKQEKGDITGYMRGVDAQGGLLLQTNQCIERVVSGEIWSVESSQKAGV